MELYYYYIILLSTRHVSSRHPGFESAAHTRARDMTGTGVTGLDDWARDGIMYSRIGAAFFGSTAALTYIQIKLR